MPVHNSEIADLLELQAANPFRIRVYRNAARMLGKLGRSVKTMVERAGGERGVAAWNRRRVLRDVIYGEDKEHGERRYTVVTAPVGPLAGRRVVRGREADCRDWTSRA